MAELRACIFDLDGVLVDSAKYHYQAWRRLANELGFDLSTTQNDQLKGINRMRSLEMILEFGGQSKEQDEKYRLCYQKNEWYKELIAEMQASEVLPGARELLEELKQKKIAIALGSASKNASFILDKVELDAYFEVVIDGTKTSKSKPDPEVFLLGAKGLKQNPANCVVFEDAPAGIEAALAANMFAVGVGEYSTLEAAHIILPDLDGLRFSKLQELLTF